MKVLLICLLAIFATACETPETAQSKKNRIAFESCIDQGGVPITSDWSSALKDCKFK